MALVLYHRIVHKLCQRHSLRRRHTSQAQTITFYHQNQHIWQHRRPQQLLVLDKRNLRCLRRHSHHHQQQRKPIKRLAITNICTCIYIIVITEHNKPQHFYLSNNINIPFLYALKSLRTLFSDPLFYFVLKHKQMKQFCTYN